jgi:hypothetical protein
MTRTRLANAPRTLAELPLTPLLVAAPGLVVLSICIYQLYLPNAFLGVRAPTTGFT